MKRKAIILSLCLSLLIPAASYADRKESNGHGHRQNSQTHRGTPSHKDGSVKKGNGHAPGITYVGHDHPNKNKPNKNKPNKNKPNKNKPQKPMAPGHPGYKPGHNPKPAPNKRPGVPPPGMNNHKPSPHPGKPVPPGSHFSHGPGAHMRPVHYHNKGYRYTNVLRNMIYNTVRGAKYRNVWMVSPGVYVVSYIQGPYTFYRYLYPETGSYGAPIRLVYDAPGGWYAYNDNGRYFYEDGNVLRISLNGVPQTPWSLVPSIDLNLHF